MRLIIILVIGKRKKRSVKKESLIGGSPINSFKKRLVPEADVICWRIPCQINHFLGPNIMVQE